MIFPNEKFVAQKDRYAKNRGGNSAFLYISCSKCMEPMMVYQKDGEGRLLRCYADRIVWPQDLVEKQSGLAASNIKGVSRLACCACNNVFGLPMIYEKENRPAYRIIPGSIHISRSLSRAQEIKQ